MARVNAQKYDNLSTSELARITRQLGLEKPDVLTAGEWAAWLRENDGQSVLKQEAKAEGFDAMTVDELKAYATDNNIDLHGARKRDDIIAVLNNPQPAEPESSTTNDEADES